MPEDKYIVQKIKINLKINSLTLIYYHFEKLKI